MFIRSVHFAVIIPVLFAMGARAESAVAPVLPDLAKNTDTIAKALTDLAPEGWEANGPVERYVVANMYDKINGRSELFMSYGVTGMVFVTLSQVDDGDKFVDIFLYDMTTAPGAFGVFGVERWPGNDARDLGREGYRTRDDIFFWKGRYYATLVGSDDSVAKVQEEIAKTIADRLADKEETPWGIDLLPKEKQLPETLQYFMVDALSLEFLTNTFTAEYDWAEESVKIFVSLQPSEEKADAVNAAFGKYMEEYGTDVDRKDIKGTLVKTANMGGGRFDAVFHQGSYVAGVTAAPDRATAEAGAQRLYDLLRK